MFSTPYRSTLFRLALALFLNVLFFIATLAVYRGTVDREVLFRIGSVYPLILPNVLVTMEDTQKFSIHGALANEEWDSSTPTDEGYIRLGKERRLMGLSFGHEIHCVQALRAAAAYPNGGFSSEHIHHCLNYLRSYILCDPDLTFERFDPLEGNFTVPSFGATHICRDWRVAYGELARAFSEDAELVEKSHRDKWLP